jgi:hypothetical protein
MVIFGAGASYDSCSTFTDESGVPEKIIPTWRPPLASELFNPRFADQLKLFEEVLDVAPRLQEKKGRNVELSLQEMTSSKEPATEKQLVAIRYYILHMLTACVNGWNQESGGISNYRALLNDIRRSQFQRNSNEKVCLVTFNYDTLLEDAVQKVTGLNVKIRSIRDYVASDWPIFKLHGSVNWGRVLKINEPYFAEMDTIERARAIIDRWPIEVSDTYAFDSGGTGLATVTPIPAGALLLLPAIAIPMHKKDQFELPREHEKQLAEILPSVSKVLVVGWRGAEDRFLQMLMTGLGSETEFLAVSSGKKSAEEVINTISKAGVQMKNYLTANGGFTSSLDKEIKDFLKN